MTKTKTKTEKGTPPPKRAPRKKPAPAPAPEAPAAAPVVRHATREEWLTAAVEHLRARFPAELPVPPRVRVSCGWPRSRSGGKGAQRAIGEAWSAIASADGTPETFVSPELDDPAVILATLAHELCHHAVEAIHPGSGHRGAFPVLATKIGLEGPPTATYAGAALEAELRDLAGYLGAYPGARLDPQIGMGERKPQKNRSRKVVCGACGCIVRMTRQWLADPGPPHCACGGGVMMPEAADDDAGGDA